MPVSSEAPLGWHDELDGCSLTASTSVALFGLQSPLWWSQPSWTCARAWGAASPCAAPCWRAAPWRWPPPSGASMERSWHSPWQSSRTTRSWRWTPSAGRPAVATSAAFPTTWGSPPASSKCLVSWSCTWEWDVGWGREHGKLAPNKLMPVQATSTASSMHGAVFRRVDFQEASREICFHLSGSPSSLTWT